MATIRPLLPAALLAALLALASPAPQARATDMFGPGHSPCGDRTSTMDITACTAAKTRAWDTRLNAAYAAMMAAAAPGQREPLRAAQRLWIQYRDANCGFYDAAEGSIHQVLAAECLRAMTEDRARELEQAAKP